MGVILSAIIAVQAVGVFNTDVLAASKHSHKYKTYYEGMQDETKHRTVTKCTTCGNVNKTGQATHSRGSIVGYSTYNANRHYVTYKCKNCGENYKKTASHVWDKATYTSKNGNYHTVTQKCKNCGATKSSDKKHSFSRGICKCGRNISQGRPATTRRGKGLCGLGVDAWVYPRCNKCNSDEWEFDYNQYIGYFAGTRRKIHQHVRCTNCGNKYTNLCYME